ncbi:MAG TPA: hypothetical protein VG848_12720 [Acetobacteraceae bacterium]|nr:hypothetical protein [Acetobacteraceae bacterium]
MIPITSWPQRFTSGEMAVSPGFDNAPLMDGIAESLLFAQGVKNSPCILVFPQQYVAEYLAAPQSFLRFLHRNIARVASSTVRLDYIVCRDMAPSTNFRTTSRKREDASS